MVPIIHLLLCDASAAADAGFAAVAVFSFVRLLRLTKFASRRQNALGD